MAIKTKNEAVPARRRDSNRSKLERFKDPDYHYCWVAGPEERSGIEDQVDSFEDQGYEVCDTDGVVRKRKGLVLMRKPRADYDADNAEMARMTTEALEPIDGIDVKDNKNEFKSPVTLGEIHESLPDKDSLKE